MKNKIALFAGSFIVWACLNWPLNAQDIIIGILAAGAVVLLACSIFTQEGSYFGSFSRYFWLIAYALLLFRESLRASFDIALRVIKPEINISPEIIEVKVKIKSEAGLAILANSLSMAKGMLCLDGNPDEGILYIHCLDAQAKSKAHSVTKKFEKILKKVFK